MGLANPSQVIIRSAVSSWEKLSIVVPALAVCSDCGRNTSAERGTARQSVLQVPVHLARMRVMNSVPARRGFVAVGVLRSYSTRRPHLQATLKI